MILLKQGTREFLSAFIQIQDECNYMIGAHNISRKSVLRQISHKNKVLLPIAKGFTNDVMMKPVPIDNATTFRGFCKKHDEMFAPIDDPNFVIDQTSQFLLAYRSFALTYYKLKNEYNCHIKMCEKYSYNTVPTISAFYSNLLHNIFLLDEIKAEFDRAITSSETGILTSRTLILKSQIYFAASTSIIPMYDFKGNRIHANVDTLPLLVFLIN